MSAKRTRKSKTPFEWIHSTRLHVIMFGMLMIATPFLMLRAFLQDAIGSLSRLTFSLAGIEMPIVLTVVTILVITLLILFRARLTWRRVFAGLLALLLVALNQQFSDYYFGHKFYDLQQNWHYIAYGLFAFMMYRDLSPRKFPFAKILLTTYFVAVFLSAFDETFQKYISTRIFDICDIAKDAWGVFIGSVLISFGGKPFEELRARGARFRHAKLRDYVQSPRSVLFLLFILSLLFNYIASLLTEYSYAGTAVLITLSSFALFFILFHISQYRWGKYGLLAVLVVGLLTQTYFFLKYRKDDVVYNKYGLTVYKGIPIFFFDIMIFPDGTFRLVDKKHDFNYRDKLFFMSKKTDIIVIGSGAQGKGGIGFPTKNPNQFVFNKYLERGTQILILRTPEACQVFNRLRREHKNVLFILHNTC